MTSRASSPAHALAQVAPFSGLGEAALGRVAERANRQVLGRGSFVFVQDEPGDRMFVLVAGVVKLTRRSRHGDVVELVRHTPPAGFGELALLDGGPRSASAEVVEQATVLSVTRADLLATVHSEQQAVDALLSQLGAIVRRTTDQMTALVFLDVQGRVARQLLLLADGGRGGARLGRVTQTELAAMVGGARQTVNAALKGFEERGLIRTRGWSIELTDPDGLRRLASV